MARKRRADAEAALPKRRVWNIAVYIRLSREDACCPDESESVANQRKIIEAHIAGLHDGDEYRIVDEYVDDGISGTTDDGRGGFQRMLSDIRRGRVNLSLIHIYNGRTDRSGGARGLGRGVRPLPGVCHG